MGNRSLLIKDYAHFPPIVRTLGEYFWSVFEQEPDTNRKQNATLQPQKEAHSALLDSARELDKSE